MGDGIFFVIRKSLVNSWNLYFDEQLVSYGYNEDVDYTFTYFKNAKREKLKCLLIKDFTINHFVTKNNRINNENLFKKVICNRYYLIHKHKLGFFEILSFYLANLIECVTFMGNVVKLKVYIKAFFCVKNKSAIRKGFLP
jgi:hypothetical protein